MIVLEGPDGGGKTHLSLQLRKATGLPIHARASDSLTGPTKDLYGWTVADLTTWNEQPLSIYDRHPLTSEHIYGPHVRGSVRPGFEMGNPELSQMRKFFRQHALIIVCLPPLEVVKDNVASEVEQMAGVIENIDFIYNCYYMMMHVWPVDSHIARYDYTVDPGDVHGYNGILSAVKYHMTTWRKPHYVRT